MLLQLLKDAFPEGTCLPSSCYEAKKLVKELDLGYEKIHSCPNDCMLYRGEYTDQDSCHVCGSSRWMKQKEIEGDEMNDSDTTCSKQKPAKVLRYFPLIPRLRRIYASSKTAATMRWHDEGRTKDGMLRHPADSLAWKAFDDRYPDFASDVRNVRLGLATDGFNPFRTLSSIYSTWPVILIPYNLPPWICMKQSSLILSLVIPGEKGPGNDIDVFLQPLIEELKQLWEGINVIDASNGQTFKLRAALLWTVNDFPAYANLSGWSTKGRVACPCCGDSTHSIWLKHGGKFCYMGHRRWLEATHPFRHQKDLFDGTIELGSAPIPISGADVRIQMQSMNHIYGKMTKSSKKRGRDDVETSVQEEVSHEVDASITDAGVFEDEDIFIVDDNAEDTMAGSTHRPDKVLWKKRSIFFDLPYWEHNILRHNLDVMHIEKNVCDNLIGTILNLDGKTKDNIKARLDLKELGIRHELHPQVLANDRTYIPHACYTMSNQEKDLFLTVLKNIKVPDGYASNISRCVNLKERKLSNLKSHDGHILMQDILPLALRSSMPKHVVTVIFQLSAFFKALCSKVLDPRELDQLQSRVALTLCQMEKIFPPGFFTVMVHLVVHLASEAKIGGPVHYRWMYPIERYLVRLKDYVKNKAHPEGSIAEGYIAEECLTFCSRYLDGVETVFNRPPRHSDAVENIELYKFSTAGRIIGKAESIILDQKSLAQAHRYVLLHSDIISEYRSEFLVAQRRANLSSRPNPRIEQRWLVELFPTWLSNQVPVLMKTDSSAELVALARGPNNIVKKYNGFIINGFKFHTKDREKCRKTQNSGVTVEADGKTYYGALKDIYELDYYGCFKVVLFRCDWVDINTPRGLKHDSNGFVLVNFTRLIHTGVLLKDDPFIFSSQARQVFYVQDSKDKEWAAVIKTKPRDLYDIGQRIDEDDDETYTQCMPHNIMPADDMNATTTLVRLDLEEHTIG